MDLTPRHALVTGGSSGIGLATAVRLVRSGAHLSIVARDPGRLEQARQRLEGERHGAEQRLTAWSADVADRAGLERAVAAAVAQAGPVDVLVASAGVARPGYFSQLPPEVFERSMAVNFFGALHAVRAVLPGMLRRRCGRLLLVSSGAGLTGLFGYTAYSPTKFALRGLAESLRGELRGTGVSIGVVYPPDTDTPQLRQENRTKPAETRAITEAGGLWTADDVARVMVRGLARRRFTITPGWEMTLLARLHSLLGPALQWHFDRLAARGRRRARGAP